ncbi:hypothetical protein D3C85_1185840 [compost metagenome]
MIGSLYPDKEACIKLRMKIVAPILRYLMFFALTPLTNKTAAQDKPTIVSGKAIWLSPEKR